LTDDAGPTLEVHRNVDLDIFAHNFTDQELSPGSKKVNTVMVREGTVSLRIETDYNGKSRTDIIDPHPCPLTGDTRMRKAVNLVMKAISYIFLAALVTCVLAVVLVIVGPILLNRDILADPLYAQIEDFMRQMLRYIIVATIGYIIFSWGRKLSEPRGEQEPEEKPPPAPAVPAPVVPAPDEQEPASSSRVQSQSSHSYRPEAVPPTHP